MRRIYM